MVNHEIVKDTDKYWMEFEDYHSKASNIRTFSKLQAFFPIVRL